ncbi:MAG: RNA polymerase sigma factor [Gemmatimonadetes bacterium]|nr:RNA polymerase sigma factor [Gemmatimonadota bacterium]NNM06486.1 RNA polymerase sigma factor [Gemmatimonadota bacterium]
MKPRELEAQLESLHEESFGWALSCCGHDETEAEDVLQTTYLKIITGKARFGGRSSLKTWVFGVIRRTAQEVSRRAQAERKRVLHLVTDDLEDHRAGSADQDLDKARAAERLTSAMGKLSDRQREVLHLVFYQDLSISEAADVMGVSLGSARTHYERGKERLRSLLGEGENVA